MQFGAGRVLEAVVDDGQVEAGVGKFIGRYGIVPIVLVCYPGTIEPSIPAAL